MFSKPLCSCCCRSPFTSTEADYSGFVKTENRRCLCVFTSLHLPESSSLRAKPAVLIQWGILQNPLDQVHMPTHKLQNWQLEHPFLFLYFFKAVFDSQTNQPHTQHTLLISDTAHTKWLILKEKHFSPVSHFWMHPIFFRLHIEKNKTHFFSVITPLY